MQLQKTKRSLLRTLLTGSFTAGLILSLTIGLTGCVTQRDRRSIVVIRDLKVPLRWIMKSAAYALPGGIRASSENRRVFKSKYIDLNGNRWDVLSKSLNRAYIEIAILGDLRPYIVEVSAIVEERASDSPLDQDFKRAGSSRPLAERIAKRMENYLEDRRKSQNLIDDFRAF